MIKMGRLTNAERRRAWLVETVHLAELPMEKIVPVLADLEHWLITGKMREKKDDKPKAPVLQLKR